jgi:hypothetical protein
MTAPAPIAAALREACEASRQAYEEDLDHAGIAAATVAAFLRYFTGPNRMAMLYGENIPERLTPWLAEQVERAAREGGK